MGMDVYGKAPTCEAGKYFRNNVWWWRPLADCILQLCPDEAAPCKYWGSNDGDGLDGPQAIALADKLDALIENGSVEAWIKIRQAELNALPDIKCTCCDGTGIRSDEIGKAAGWPTKIVEATDADGRPNPRAGQIGSCNGCGGSGRNRAWEANYPADVDNMRAFSRFARASGGFEIC